ncbi:hypothetical protein GU926_08160 [Nibribacter ruber]|uniref:Glycoside hydrolase family 19 catalytic domain-containing protein n=1 Tax=Nibribacter ruber TaxID=2698458 RepID=A0A6P1NYV8_9BACT|nr:hypothetical protein [Nibribacter ruber]QHL87409.1 hypothetical protein GU926_08160 [Nibribacter ruber]
MKAFFDNVRVALFGNSIPQSAVAAIELIVKTCKDRGVTQLEQIAYVLATVFHEVGEGMVPTGENLNYSAQGLANNWPGRYAVDPKAKVKVPNALAKKLAHKPQAIANNCYCNRMGNGNEASGEGWKFRGRDFCQTTGKDNYRRAGTAVGVDLVAHPERIAELPIAVNTLVVGMRDGWFTTRKLSHFITTKSCDFTSARAIINGSDKAAKVASYAADFLKALRLLKQL